MCVYAGKVESRHRNTPGPRCSTGWAACKRRPGKRVRRIGTAAASHRSGHNEFDGRVSTYVRTFAINQVPAISLRITLSHANLMSSPSRNPGPAHGRRQWQQNEQRALVRAHDLVSIFNARRPENRSTLDPGNNIPRIAAMLSLLDPDGIYRGNTLLHGGGSTPEARNLRLHSQSASDARRQLEAMVDKLKDDGFRNAAAARSGNNNDDDDNSDADLCCFCVVFVLGLLLVVLLILGAAESSRRAKLDRYHGLRNGRFE
ncbi:hypothetical protein BKA81DRAFT_382865 [Phyllosticta paracitricarpa]|uniref:Uncharacterized protein n=1 Tax=Phyllosticta paracitricarpa TaxID=2016321 RepID=A0ABR1NJN3_9PEZI